MNQESYILQTKFVCVVINFKILVISLKLGSNSKQGAKTLVCTNIKIKFSFNT